MKIGKYTNNKNTNKTAGLLTQTGLYLELITSDS